MLGSCSFVLLGSACPGVIIATTLESFLASDVFSSKNVFLIFHSTGGRIDHGHHSNKAVRALRETVALNEAVTKAMEMTDRGKLLQPCVFCQSFSEHSGGPSEG